MFIKRLGLYIIACAALVGCGTLNLGGHASGVSIVAQDTYCGTPSQASEVHYFANPNSFGSWIDYRNVSEFDDKLASNGVLIVEMGQRPTGGYHLSLDDENTKVDGKTLTIAMDWHAPRLDAAVSQALTSQCVALKLPEGSYTQVRVVDQLGNLRSALELE